MRHSSRTAESPQARLLWTFIASLALAQGVALWLLCSHQVRTAAVRNAGLQVERTAMAECLRHIPQATRNSCARRIATRSPGADAMPGGQPPESGTALMSSPVPVNFTIR